MTSPKLYQAVVFGASGVTGWGILNQCLVYPSEDTFTRVIGITKRWPPVNSLFEASNDRVSVYGGVDLKKGPEVVAPQLMDTAFFGRTTHVYYAVSSSSSDPPYTHVSLLSTAIQAVERLCPGLLFVTIQTSIRASTLQVHSQPDATFLNLFEENVPRLIDQFAPITVPYAQQLELLRLSKGKEWTFCMVRSNLVIGYTPRQKLDRAVGETQYQEIHSFAQALGLSLCWDALIQRSQSIRGGVCFPGSSKVYNVVHTNVGQELLARAHIYLSLHIDRDKIAKRVFEIADGNSTSWKHVWPGVCEMFGLKGVPPKPGAAGVKLAVKYFGGLPSTWADWEKSDGSRKVAFGGMDWALMDEVFCDWDIEQHLNLSAIRGVGFKESEEALDGYRKAFEKMRECGSFPEDFPL